MSVCMVSTFEKQTRKVSVENKWLQQVFF